MLSKRTLVALVTCLALALALAACGGQKAGAPSQPPAKSGEAAKAEPAAKAEAPKGAEYPAGPVKMIVSRGAGGSNDQIARLVQPYFSKYLGAPVAVENITGAGGAVGNNQVYKSKPDGYTLLCTTTISDIIKQVAEGTPYDFKKFTPIYNIGAGDSNLVAVKADSDMKTYQDFVNKAKAGSSGLTVGRLSGINVTSLCRAFLVTKGGVPNEKIRDIPYEDGKQAVLATISGEIAATITQPSNVVDQIKAKRLRALVIFTKDRHPDMPDTPTFKELVPGEGNYYEIYQSIMGPPDMPKEIVAKLNQALDKATKDPDFVDKAKRVFALTPLPAEKLKVEIDSMFKLSEDMKPLLVQSGGGGSTGAGAKQAK